MIESELLNILCCPETRQSLTLADAELVARLNHSIQSGQALSSSGRQVKETCDAALVRADGRVAYPIRRGIPVMLVDQAVILEGPPPRTKQ